MRAIAILMLLVAIARADDEPGDAPNLAPKPEPWNQVDLKVITVRAGGGLLFDWATYYQDADARAALPIAADQKLRDFRFLLKGGFPWLTPRLTYSIGYMFDGATDTWRFRQSGLKLDLPELGGSLFVGRTKEPFSTNKIMVGYYGWTNERSAASDAFLPILADGVKWSGVGFRNRFVYGLGWFKDTLSENESFNKNDRQFAGRAVFLPNGGTGSSQVIHFAIAGRFADSNDGKLSYRSKPESFSAQEYVVETGKFNADSSVTIGLEAYYRPGPLTLGSEYYFNKVQSSEAHDPLFHGGEVFAAYLFTGEVHPYLEKLAAFGAVSPSHSIYKGGLGAWEGVVRFSYVDLDSGTIAGGKFWRITPMINWYLSDNLRLEVVYGYGRFDRENTGWEGTQFFQGRIQLTLD
jgi:phosphate-selective porin OprO/OprP